MDDVQISLLGRVEVVLRHGSAVHIPRRKALALLAYLSLPPGAQHQRDKLAALLWGDTSNERARHSLRQALATIRAELPIRDLLGEHGDLVTLDPAVVDVDVMRFERLVSAASPEALEEAARLYRGDLAEGLGVSEPAFEEWLVAERVRLRELAVTALTRLLGHQVKAPEADGAIQTAVRLLALDALQEPVHRALMRLYAGQGRRGAALRQYQTCQGLLRRELGADPEPETRALYVELLQQDPDRTVPADPLVAAATDTPLIGRGTELARLAHWRDEAWKGTSRLVLVAGEAGIGKSRLIAEASVEAQARGARVLIGRAYEGERLPFGPWVDALRGGGLVAFARESEIDERWRSELGRLFPELAPAGLAPPRAEDYVRLFEATAVLLRAAAARQPLALVLEDLHWTDELSLRLLAFLSRRLAGAPVLLLATLREEEVAAGHALGRTLAELEREGCLLKIDLGGLDHAETVTLVEALVPAGTAAPVLARLAQQAWTASGGNPLVIVETMRSLDPATPGTTPALPSRVREIIAARIDRLQPRSRGVLAVAAAIGREFEFALLERAAGTHPRETAEAIEELVGHRLLHAVGERLDFTHDRVRRVAYERIVAGGRAAFHRAIAGALESLHHDRLDEVADQLGLHYERAGDAARAITYLIKAAELATQRYALDDALASLEQATTAADHLPEGDRDRARLDLLLRRALTLSLQARQREILELLRAHAALQARVADPALAAEYHFRVAITSYYLGDYAQAKGAAEQALREAEGADDDERLGKVLHVLALTGYALGLAREGIGHGTRAVRLLDRPRTTHWLGLASYSLGLCHLIAGDLDAAAAAHERCRTIGAAAQDPRLEAFGEAALAWARILAGDLDEALQTAGRAIAAARDPLALTLASGTMGYVHLERGEARAAIPLLEQATRRLDGVVRQSQVRYTALLGEAYALDGAAARAGDTVRRALEMAEADGIALNLGYAERAAGRIALAGGDADEAARQFARAVDSFDRSEAAVEAAIARLDLAPILAAQGAAGAAREHLFAACRAFDAAHAPRRAAAARQCAERLCVPLTSA